MERSVGELCQIFVLTVILNLIFFKQKNARSDAEKTKNVFSSKIKIVQLLSKFQCKTTH